jgi:hypothetical protein
LGFGIWVSNPKMVSMSETSGVSRENCETGICAGGGNSSPSSTQQSIGELGLQLPEEAQQQLWATSSPPEPQAACGKANRLNARYKKLSMMRMFFTETKVMVLKRML